MAKCATTESSIASSFAAWIEALAAALSAPMPALGPSAWKAGRLTTKLAGRTLALPLSAPNTVVATLWASHGPTYLAAREQPSGKWNEIVRLTRCEGDVQMRYLALVEALQTSGATAEAQLGWMQARMIQDPDDRADGLFAQLFAKLPRSATIDVARSAAALLERLLPFSRSKSAVDRLIAADAIREHAHDACTDVAGARRSKLTAVVDRAVTLLSEDREPSIVDTIKLGRQAWARSLAFSV